MDVEAEIATTLDVAHRHEGVRPVGINHAGIRAAVRPSNLTAPTRLSEKYAPDSCLADLQLKYVYLQSELLSAQPRSLTLQQTLDTATPSKPKDDDLSLAGKSFIPGLVVYERSAWQRSPALESFLRTSVPQSLASSRSAGSVIPDSPPKAEEIPTNKAVTVKASAPKTEAVKKTIKRVNVQIANPKLSESAGRTHSSGLSSAIPRHAAPSKLHQSGKRKASAKTQKVHQDRELNLESTGSISISEQLVSSESAGKWQDSGSKQGMKSPETRSGDEFRFSKSGSEGSEGKYEDARTKKHVHYEDEVEHKRSGRPDESIKQLEEMVEEQHKYLVEHGYLSPQSSLSGSRQKTYEDLEREIEQIKDMLGEKSSQLHPDEESGSQLTYSSDEDNSPEEQESEGEDWMSPRFTE